MYCCKIIKLYFLLWKINGIVVQIFCLNTRPHEMALNSACIIYIYTYTLYIHFSVTKVRRSRIDVCTVIVGSDFSDVPWWVRIPTDPPDSPILDFCVCICVYVFEHFVFMYLYLCIWICVFEFVYLYLCICDWIFLKITFYSF